MVQWGTVGEWAGLLGVVVPSVFWFIERRQRRAAEKRLQENQVRRVTYQEITFQRPDPPRRYRTWVLRNDSDEPLHFTAIRVRLENPGPNENPYQTAAPSGTGPLAAGEQREFIWPYEHGEKEINEVRAMVLDPDGLWWLLDDMGNRAVMPDSDAPKDPDTL
ncbi:hypothetical protein [Isoptericola sediminis]|uniref:Uncharacterized protein n=1 Tax=Isoptericola sediminis TaxID=2733572 RepID=A0A849K131_9MICO|nr:hypothetical protein [Isoptericola sediminis]NNU28454.1 hypothetical protein [Isoptericola sediminis]